MLREYWLTFLVGLWTVMDSNGIVNACKQVNLSIPLVVRPRETMLMQEKRLFPTLEWIWLCR